MGAIMIDTWLYGCLAKYGGPASQRSFAHLEIPLPEESTVADLLACLEMPGEARGITFINGELSAMPGVQPDLTHQLKDGDRVAFFDPLSMWPSQYRFGAAMVKEMSTRLEVDKGGDLHHSFKEKE